VVVILGELLSGLRAGTWRIENEEVFTRFLRRGSVGILNATEETALRYTEVDGSCEKRGRPFRATTIGLRRLRSGMA
jgi:hypothetical protein